MPGDPAARKERRGETEWGYEYRIFLKLGENLKGKQLKGKK
jgi:predicted SPOUT superfamily RNA methylase MTH1